MNLQNLDTFIAVAELQSFTRAAEKLGYAQSTVSFQIRQLETELNLALFDRINHSVSLTEAGRQLLKTAYRIHAELEQFHNNVRSPAEICGKVRMATADSLCSSLFSRLFPALHRQHPGISLEIIAADTPEMFRLLDHNEVDLVCTLDSHIYDANYPILCEKQIIPRFVIAAGHPLAQRRDLSLADILDHPFLLTEKGMSYRKLLDQALASRSAAIDPIFVSGNVDLLCQLTAQEVGISYLPEFAYRPYQHAGQLVPLQIADYQSEIWVQLLTHKDKWQSDAVHAVTAEIRRTLSENK